MNASDSSDKSDPSDSSDKSDPSAELRRLLPKHGGYRKLRSYQTALIVFDATVIFCQRFIKISDRTYDQMIQAARSGVRNISEGSMASGTSKKTEIKLTNVARSSLEELLGDYEDYLRHRGLPIWDKDSPQALAVRRRWQSDTPDMAEFRTMKPEIAANTLLCLINQATYLLHRQLQRLDQDFVQHGGFTERLYTVRTEARQQQADPSGHSDDARQTPPPLCPACGKPMPLRTAGKGPRAGQKFWGCSAYPDCKSTRPVEPPPQPK